MLLPRIPETLSGAPIDGAYTDQQLGCGGGSPLPPGARARPVREQVTA